MVFGWIGAKGARDEEVAATRARIPASLWAQTMAAYPFLAMLDPDEREALHARVAWLLASKTINGAAGLDVDDGMRLAIAAQACLPILWLSPARYAGWEEIIVYPSGFMVRREAQDEAGVVHDYMEEASGEAWEGGPLILSWADAQAGGEATAPAGYNVVIHEFAHKLDLDGGHADGVPDLSAHRPLDSRVWRRTLARNFDAFVDMVERVEAAIPADVDPETDAADAWYGQLPLDPYAATDEAEFFAVSSEHFFVDPAPLAEALPEWYALLATYYRQDPLARMAAAGLMPTQP